MHNVSLKYYPWLYLLVGQVSWSNGFRFKRLFKNVFCLESKNSSWRRNFESWWNSLKYIQINLKNGTWLFHEIKKIIKSCLKYYIFKSGHFLAEVKLNQWKWNPFTKQKLLLLQNWQHETQWSNFFL